MITALNVVTATATKLPIAEILVSVPQLKFQSKKELVFGSYVALVALSPSETCNYLSRVLIFNGLDLLTRTLARFLVASKVD